MRLRANNPLAMTAVSLLLGAAGCSKSPPAASSVQATDAVQATNADHARVIPRRSAPLVVTNHVTVVQPAAAPATNNPPTITCAAPQSLPCMSPDGVQSTLTAHVEDPDGNALSVVWNIDGRDRYTQQVTAGGPPTSADLTYTYSFTPGDHAIKVIVSDGSLSATCETTLSFQKDAQNPVIVCPQDIALPVDPGTCTAVVTFSPKATDNCPDVAVVCQPPSGTAFPIGATTVTCTATDLAGNASPCAFAVTVQVSDRCPQSARFWQQHAAAWPVNSLTLGNASYTKGQLMGLLRVTVPQDASMALGTQLIAAALNTASGSDPRLICGELAQAHRVLAGFSGKLPFRVNPTSTAGRAMQALTTRLNAYNNGLVAQPCAP